jgi:hypothetical protein
MMATDKQRKAIEKIVENRGNVSKSMRQAGYSNSSAKNPANLIESKGYFELMDEYGLSDDLIISSLVSDIKNKPGRRIAELSLAAKIKGLMRERTDLTSRGEKYDRVVIYRPEKLKPFS